MATPRVSRLVVFSDDWGRHPSSAQHLVSRLLGRYPTLWVNTIGTRRPGLSWGDMQKIGVKLRQWARPVRSAGGGGVIGGDRAATGRPATVRPDSASGGTGGTFGGEDGRLPANLTVLTPRMWPGFRRGWQRRLNCRLIGRAVNRVLGPRGADERRVVITTLPITADLVGAIDADYWVYYCVDDWSSWPGVDGSTLGEMERSLAAGARRIVAVSETLRERLAGLGREAELLSHGIDLDHWRPLPSRGASPDGAPARGAASAALPDWWSKLCRPIILFWGLIDRRLDTAWVEALCARQMGSVVLVGPQQAPDPRLAELPGLVLPGPVAYAQLPALAAGADALVMPYADLPVTRAMQPLKLLEYLATGKPVIVPDLPATRAWARAADVATNAEDFVRLVGLRLQTGATDEQLRARQRIEAESWDHKARQFEQIVFGGAA
jgi:glycosyltransferase involved in cell wall biosynthesis